MKTIFRKLSVSLGRSNGSWLTLLLLLVVLVPSACLLWFMNQAVQNERLAVRQKLVEAYRSHLSLAQERLQTYWKQDAEELRRQAEALSAPALFAQQIRSDRADAIVCFDAGGNVTYPNKISAPGSATHDPLWAEAQRLEATDLGAAANAYARLSGLTTNVNLAALALQSQARCLMQSGNKTAAATVLTGALADARYRNAIDEQGRLIVPNAELMAVELLKDSAPDEAQLQFERLRTRLLDYDDPALAAPQRRFLMRELQRLFPQAQFPTLAAEDLAARYVESEKGKSDPPGLSKTSLDKVWQFASNDGRVVALHWDHNLIARLERAVSSQALPDGVKIVFQSPGAEVDGVLLDFAAGSEMEGWKLGLVVKDDRLFDAAAKDRVASYVWIGVLVVGTVLILALLALGMIRRQAALTQLRNDLVANVTHELKTPLSSMRLLVETLLASPQIDQKTAREYLQLIASENIRLSRLIDNFLTFSRIERNKYTFDFKEVPAASIAEVAAAAVRERFNTPGCRFEIRIPAGLPTVRADADAMVTALLNLLDNAFKYSGDTKQIALTAGAENASVFFSVKDNGIGLLPRDTKRVFKRFYRVNQHFSRSGGAGLGLSIVQFVVNAHHGTVQVESEPQRGSTFTVTIPATHPHHHPEKKL